MTGLSLDWLHSALPILASLGNNNCLYIWLKKCYPCAKILARKTLRACGHPAMANRVWKLSCFASFIGSGPRPHKSNKMKSKTLRVAALAVLLGVSIRLVLALTVQNAYPSDWNSMGAHPHKESIQNNNAVGGANIDASASWMWFTIPLQTGSVDDPNLPPQYEDDYYDFANMYPYHGNGGQALGSGAGSGRLHWTLGNSE